MSRQRVKCGLVAASAALFVLGAALPAQAQDAKKPNILFIMGDDVGWFNIGAITRASCPARRRTSTSSPSQGMRFTDYYAEASCTAGRCELHHRRNSAPHGSDDRRPGRRRCRHAGAGLHARHRPESARLCHRPVRQEPPRRPEQVPADGAWLRRVLRLPVPPRRDVRSVLVFVPDRSRPTTTSTARAVWCTARRPIPTIATVMPRWGKVGKQKIVDEGPLPPFPDMSNVPNMHDLPFAEGEIRHDDLRRSAGQDLAATSWTRPRRTASRSSSGTTRRACTSGRSFRRSTRR